jgi:predicted secreted hydrolase
VALAAAVAAPAALDATRGSPTAGDPAGSRRASPGPDREWAAAAPLYPWSFPRDHWAHRDYAVEWWYVTGHLESESDPQRRFGFQFTVFRVGLRPGPLPWRSDWAASHLLMGHGAITDRTGARHVFSELLVRETPWLGGFPAWPDPRIAWSRGPAGTDEGWSLRWNGEAFDLSMRDDAQGIGFELSTRPEKPLVFQGPGGYGRKSDERNGAASLYYSFTRLRTRGTLDFGAGRHAVRGESWMDHEFGTGSLAAPQVGWDWFGLQLDDGREIMLYLLRRADGSPDFAWGTLVGPEADARYLAGAQWSVRTRASWTSPVTRCTYPARWTVKLPGAGIVLEVRADVADQENVARLAGGLHYWEGAVTVLDERGRAVGRGYVELTGYGETGRPPV